MAFFIHQRQGMATFFQPYFLLMDGVGYTQKLLVDIPINPGFNRSMHGFENHTSGFPSEIPGNKNPGSPLGIKSFPSSLPPEGDNPDDKAVICDIRYESGNSTIPAPVEAQTRAVS